MILRSPQPFSDYQRGVWHKEDLRFPCGGVPVVQRKQIKLGTMRLQVQSLALLRRLRIRHCRELWCRSQTWLLDMALQWLCCSQEATAPIWPLAWETPYASDVALKSKTTTTTTTKKDSLVDPPAIWGSQGVAENSIALLHHCKDPGYQGTSQPLERQETSPFWSGCKGHRALSWCRIW